MSPNWRRLIDVNNRCAPRCVFLKVQVKLRYCLILLLLSVCLVTIYVRTLPVYKINPANYTYVYPIHALPTEDYGRLIDLENFQFKIMANVCYDSSPLLLILVHSKPSQFEKRKTIRETWGQARDEIKVIFMLGKVDDDTLETQLQRENEIFKDFVRGNFMDTYRNLTYKHVMVLKYVIYHCPQAKYILKIDDDVFVNIDAVLDFLKEDLSPHGASDLLLCVLITNFEVIRIENSPYYVSEKKFPNTVFPNYCSGPVIMYSPDVVFRLYKESQRSIYFFIEDVHITGILAEKVNIKHTNIRYLTLSKTTQNSMLDGQEYRSKFLFGSHPLSTDHIRSLWNITRRQSSIKYIRNRRYQL